MAQLSRKDGVDRQDDIVDQWVTDMVMRAVYRLNMGRICESKWGRHLSEIKDENDQLERRRMNEYEGVLNNMK